MKTCESHKKVESFKIVNLIVDNLIQIVRIFVLYNAKNVITSQKYLDQNQNEAIKKQN